MKPLFLIYLFVSINMYAERISITIDDAPRRGTSLYSGDERSDKLIEIFDKHSIKVAFYVNSSKFQKSNGLARIKRYDRNGHFIANHTHSHPNLDKVSSANYIAEIDKAHNLITQFKNFRSWFRYPYLKHGNSVEKRDTIRNHLSKRGYSHGYVTIDNQDWYMSSLVESHLRKGGKIDKIKLCNTYTEILWDGISYFDEAAKKHLKYSPIHSLLLHENDLAALCLDILISKIKLEGWEIVSPDIAIKDKIYTVKPNTLFNNNGIIAAIINEATSQELADPWSKPWNDGEKIRKEFAKQNIFIK